MTGSLRRLDGPEYLADHDRRIAALERRLRVSQTDLPKRLVSGGFGGVPATLSAAQTEPIVPTATDYVPNYSLPYTTGGGETFFTPLLSGLDIVGTTGIDAGTYVVHASCNFDYNAGGNYRELRLQGDDGSGWFDLAGSDPPPTGGSRSTWLTATGMTYTTAGTDFRIWVRHDAGANVVVRIIRLTVFYLGPLTF